ncbi:clavesin-2 isoform X2 [Aethina tumida]|nr:clavesin-2 isoform X2 [Aethina tumida]
MSEYMEFDWRHSVISPDIMKNVPQTREPFDRSKSIQSLRKMINQCEDLELRNKLPQDDKTLQKFLYARKFDIQETFDLLKNFYLYRKRNMELFQNFDLHAHDIHKALENGLPGVLPIKDRKGRCVLVFNATNWDCGSYTLITIYRALLYSLEQLTDDVTNQANGFVVIVDWTEFTFKQVTSLKPGALKLMIEGLQDCFPARFKGIHFIGQPWYVEAALTVIKPFLKEKIKERMYVHGNNLSTLHEHVHRDILPAEMGGEQPSYNPRSWLDTLLSNKKDEKK